MPLLRTCELHRKDVVADPAAVEPNGSCASEEGNIGIRKRTNINSYSAQLPGFKCRVLTRPRCRPSVFSMKSHHLSASKPHGQHSGRDILRLLVGTPACRIGLSPQLKIVENLHNYPSHGIYTHGIPDCLRTKSIRSDQLAHCFSATIDTLYCERGGDDVSRQVKYAQLLNSTSARDHRSGKTWRENVIIKLPIVIANAYKFSLFPAFSLAVPQDFNRLS